MNNKMLTTFVCMLAVGICSAAVVGSQKKVVYRLVSGETIQETVTERGSTFQIDTDAVTFIGNYKTSLSVFKLNGDDSDRCYISPLVPSKFNSGRRYNDGDADVVDATFEETQNYAVTDIIADPSLVTDDVIKMCQGKQLVWAVPTVDPTKTSRHRRCILRCIRICINDACIRRCMVIDEKPSKPTKNS